MLGYGNPAKTLIMKGPDGEKKYSVESAKWCIEDGNVREDVPYLICLRVECDSAVWEISFPEVEEKISGTSPEFSFALSSVG